MCSLSRPSMISLISLLVIRLLVFNIAVARIKGKIGLGSLFCYLGGFSLYIMVLVNSLLSIKSRSRFLNPISSSAIPYSWTKLFMSLSIVQLFSISLQISLNVFILSASNFFVLAPNFIALILRFQGSLQRNLKIKAFSMILLLSLHLIPIL